VRISEQAATSSLYSINLLVFTAEIRCVYCAVRTGLLKCFGLQNFSGARSRSQASPCGICGKQSDTERGFSCTTVFPCPYHSTNAPYSSSSTHCYYRKDRWAKPGNLPQKKMFLRKSGSKGLKTKFTDIFLALWYFSGQPGYRSQYRDQSTRWTVLGSKLGKS